MVHDLAFPILGDALGGLFALGFIVFVLVIVIIAMIQNLIYICQPNEVLIFSGAVRTEGRKLIGYKIVKGGRAVRVPLFETVDRMDLTNMPIEVEVKGAYSKGGIPLNVQGVANVKIAGESPALDNAIQRFLGKPRVKIMQIAKETLEGNLRGVLATLTPEEVNGEKEKFTRKLQEEANEGLHKLGLTLDTLKIQNVSDDVSYLNSIGRKQTAEIVRSARVAEAKNKSQSQVQGAKNRQEAELSRLEAELNVARAESERRTRNAETMQQALVAEAQGQVAAQVAKATAELKLQEARVEQMKNKLEAEVVAPARAQCAADIAKAQGEAAKIFENGRATATAMLEQAKLWKKMGANARDVFLLQKLEAILPIYLSSIKGLRVDKISMLQGSKTSGNPASGIIATLESIRAGTGLDLAKTLAKLSGQPIESYAFPIDEDVVETVSESAPVSSSSAPLPPPLPPMPASPSPTPPAMPRKPKRG